LSDTFPIQNVDALPPTFFLKFALE